MNKLGLRKRPSTTRKRDLHMIAKRLLYVMTKHGPLWPKLKEVRVFKFSVGCAIIMIISQVHNWGFHDIDMIVVSGLLPDLNKPRSL